MQNNVVVEVDPDAVICWIGTDPSFQPDLSCKNLIGQASGESYMFEWDSSRRATIIVQPNERDGSGINPGMDCGSSGQRAQRQQQQSARGESQNIGNTLGQLENLMSGGTGGFGQFM